MSRPEELRRAAENTLYGLTADDSLKYRILQKAAEHEDSKKRKLLHPLPALCSVLAMLFVAILALNSLQPVNSAGPGEINAFTAGNIQEDLSEEVSNPFKRINSDSVISVNISGESSVNDHDMCAALIALLQDAAASDAARIDSAKKCRLQISSSDGTVYEFDADNPYLSDSEGHNWNCSEFFSEFDRLVKEQPN